MGIIAGPGQRPRSGPLISERPPNPGIRRGKRFARLPVRQIVSRKWGAGARPAWHDARRRTTRTAAMEPPPPSLGSFSARSSRISGAGCLGTKYRMRSAPCAPKDSRPSRRCARGSTAGGRRTEERHRPWRLQAAGRLRRRICPVVPIRRNGNGASEPRPVETAHLSFARRCRLADYPRPSGPLVDVTLPLGKSGPGGTSSGPASQRLAAMNLGAVRGLRPDVAMCGERPWIQFPSCLVAKLA